MTRNDVMRSETIAWEENRDSSMFGLLSTTKEGTMGSKLFHVKLFLCLELRFWENTVVYVL